MAICGKKTLVRSRDAPGLRFEPGPGLSPGAGAAPGPGASLVRTQVSGVTGAGANYII